MKGTLVMGGLLSDIIMVFITHYALLQLYHGGSSMIILTAVLLGQHSGVGIVALILVPPCFLLYDLR